MIPNRIRSLLLEQGLHERGAERVIAEVLMMQLGVKPTSEFYDFYSIFDPFNIRSKNSMEQLEDILPGLEDLKVDTNLPIEDSPIAACSQYLWDMWELPEDFLALTSLEADGGYIYSISKDCVYEIENYQAEDLKNGLIEPQWSTFYEFIDWYLS